MCSDEPDACRSAWAPCNSKSQIFRRWLCLLCLSLLLLFWFGVVITRDDASPAAAQSSGLRGCMRISPSGKSQFLDIHCNQCALVSSSGQMLGAGAGSEIDRTECVIRMNNAPTAGYEKDVGSRTSIRVVSHTSVPLLVKSGRRYFQQQAGTTYVFWGPERNMRQDGKGQVFNVLLRMASKYPNVRLYALTKDKIQECDGIFQNETGKDRMKTGAFLSTGFFTMILALEMCDSISVYGMIDNNYCSHVESESLSQHFKKKESFCNTLMEELQGFNKASSNLHLTYPCFVDMNAGYRANHSVVPYHYYEQNQINECRMYKFNEHTQHGGHRFITEKAIFAKWAKNHKIHFKYPSWNLGETKS